MRHLFASRVVLLCLLPLAAYAQDPTTDPSQGEVSGTDVYSIQLQGGDPGSSPGPGVVIPPVGIPGNQVPTINLGRFFGKSSDPCHGHFSPLTGRQYFEVTAHPNQWLCAENGISPGVHRVCADLVDVPKSCYDPNHQQPATLRIVQNCLDVRTSCGQLLQRENCADLYRLQSELASGVQFPAPGAPAQALTNWTPLYLAKALPNEIRACGRLGLRPEVGKFDNRTPTGGTPKLDTQTNVLTGGVSQSELAGGNEELGPAPPGMMWVHLDSPYDGPDGHLNAGTLFIWVPIATEKRKNWSNSAYLNKNNRQAFFWASVAFDETGKKLSVLKLTTLSGRVITPLSFKQLGMPNYIMLY